MPSAFDAHGLEWDELRQVEGIAELPFPWPVQRAIRLGLHASQRRFYRVLPREAAVREPGAAAPVASAVLVVYRHDDATEVRRYLRAARWMQAAAVRVPRVFGSSSRALLVEDGGDLLFADLPAGAGLPDRYREATAAILALQAHGLREPGPNADWSLDAERLRRELEFTEQHALRGWLETGPSPVREGAFDRLAKLVSRQPRRICHRDYHSRNILVDQKLMIVDFQDAMSGPLFYDLASLLRDDYRDVPTACAAAAVETFWLGVRTDLAVSAMAEVPEEPVLLPPGARQGFCLTAAQRSLKALGTFGYQVSVVGRHEYAGYARRTWRHARRALQSLGWQDLIESLRVLDRL